MLKIRDEQMRAFELETGLEEFEREMIIHLKDFAPKHSELLGEDGVRRVMRRGIEGAKGYGFTNRGPVRLYTELMFMFGSAFDTDPLLPWAGEVLRDGSLDEQMERAARLYERLIDYIDRVVGEDRRPSIEALRRVKEVSLQVDGISSMDPAFERLVLDKIRWIYPERHAYLGDAPLQGLLRQGPAMAERCGLTTDRGVVLTVVLAFSAGHGFPRDPLFPWIEATLRNPKLETSERRVEALERRAKIYLDRALSYLEARLADV